MPHRGDNTLLMLLTVALLGGLLTRAQAAGAGDDRLTRLAQQFTDAAAPAPASTQRPARSPAATPLVAPVAPVVAAAPVAAPMAPASPEALPLGPVDAAGNLLNPTNTRADDTTSPWMLSTLTALGLVLGLILALRWALLKMSGRGNAMAAGSAAGVGVELLARTSIAPRQAVLLLRVGQRILIVGESQAGLQPLGQMDDPEEIGQVLAAVTATRNQRFGGAFGNWLERASSAYFHGQTPADEGADVHEAHLDHARDRLSNLLARVKQMGKGGDA